MYDVIIVGGGPAGATAALYANRLGLKAIVLDKAKFPRDKICGDALSGKTVRILRELDLIDGLEKLDGSDINRITFGSPSHNHFDIHLKDSKNPRHITKGYVIPRKIFDNYLFKKADAVSDTREGFTVNDVLSENGKVIGINGKNNNGEDEKLYASVVMGCDGASSIIARKLGLYKMDMKNTAIAIRCYYEGISGLTDQIELHYVEEAKPGYFWIFPAGENTANIGIGLSKNDAKKDNRSLKQIMNEIINSKFFKHRFKHSKQLETPIGWNLPLGSIHRKNHGNGYMLLGDAAGLVDPFTGEGIGNAMVSAKYAIEIACKAKKANDYSERILSEYSSLVWNEIGNELNTSSKLQDLAKYKSLLNFVINRSSESLELQDIISGMLINKFPRDKLSNPMFYLKILFS